MKLVIQFALLFLVGHHRGFALEGQGGSQANPSARKFGSTPCLNELPKCSKYVEARLPFQSYLACKPFYLMGLCWVLIREGPRFKGDVVHQKTRAPASSGRQSVCFDSNKNGALFSSPSVSCGLIFHNIFSFA